MELASKYNPSEVESKWYEYWLKNNLFSSTPDNREAYTIVIPPPNVTGILHMGHMLNETIQDILVRRARMEGKNACWVPGTDHASIATEAKVVNRLSEKGIKKSDLTRDEFLKHAWEWTDEHGGIILKQLRRVGASCDWNRTAFTMDEERSKSVIKVFIDLYNKGLIYRGARMVNWDPLAQTALSDEEVIYKEEKSKLYYLKYFCVDDKCNYYQPSEDEIKSLEKAGNIIHINEKGYAYAVVATTRPETIMGDTAMCINPNDSKNKWLSGKKVIVPLVNRCIPVIEDDYVDIDFGTGCLKVTPAHDINDYMLGMKHNLESINIFNDNGTISDIAQLYVGKDRFEVRTIIEKDLDNSHLIEKVEDYINNVGFSERTNVAIEPKLSTQWFLKMKHFADLALPPVLNDEIKFYPTKYKNTYRHWLENIKDWCISRQLWWGHRIPAYYLKDGSFVVAETIDEAVKLAQEKTGDNSISSTDLSQDEDTLDTWFSSWLWPISLFNGITDPKNKELDYYYPTCDLVTGPDIIFFWVARMIMAGYEYTGKMPFRNVYFTGIVRDKIGRKMSKTLGNSPDPLDLIDKYGADGVRMGLMLAAPAGNDILYDDALCEQGRNFCNKIWNCYRLIDGWNIEEKEQPTLNQKALDWFGALLRESSEKITNLFSKYRLSEALMEIYRLITDEFSGWLLEMIKPEYGTPIDKVTLESVKEYLNQLLHLLHPFMPFITEELWQHLSQNKKGVSLMIDLQNIEPSRDVDKVLLSDFEKIKLIVQNVRAIRNKKNINKKEVLSLNKVQSKSSEIYFEKYSDIISKMANVDGFKIITKVEAEGLSFIVGTEEYIVDLGSNIDINAEINKIEQELSHLRSFLSAIEKKLANKNFVERAPQKVVELEEKKKSDSLEKIKSLEETLKKYQK